MVLFLSFFPSLPVISYTIIVINYGGFGSNRIIAMTLYNKAFVVVLPPRLSGKSPMWMIDGSFPPPVLDGSAAVFSSCLIATKGLNALNKDGGIWW